MKSHNPPSLAANSPWQTFRKWLAPLIVLLSFGTSAFAQNSGNIIVTPSSTNTKVGQTFNVKVRVEVLQGSVDAAAVYLPFDNTILNVTAIAPSSGNPLPIPSQPLDPIGTINSSGLIRYVAGTASSFPTTSFDFLDITFSVLAQPTGGITPLNFSTGPFPNITTLRRSGTPILNSLGNGVVGISLSACATTPTANISSSSFCINGPVNLNLATSPAPTGAGPWDLTVNGTTYNNVNAGSQFASFPTPRLSIFTTTPAPPTFNNGGGIVLGVRFVSDVAGYVRAIRFFGPSVTTGTFSVQLWEEGNITAPVATGTVTSVTPNAWNQVNLASSVLINPGIVYIASYYSSAGNYTATGSGFSSQVQNGPLTALASSAGGNGVTDFGGSVSYPGQSFGFNYWTDVVFTPNTYTYNLTAVKDANECVTIGSPLQQLTVTLNATTPACGALPVSLTGLSANAQGSDIIVKWSTATEENNKGFEVQRSVTGLANDWQTIGFVAGAGNSTSLRNYTYVDANLSPRKYFYRVNQIDLNNAGKLSSVVSAEINGKVKFVLEQNYPNPFRDQGTTIRFTLPQSERVNLSLYDLHGRLIKVLVNGAKDAGTHAITVDAGSLTAGVYYYKIQAGDFSDVKKMTVQ